MSIDVQNISKVYGAQKAVNEVSFSIKKGEIVGFLGPNGAGKSTTMKIINGFLNATEGSVLVNDINVAEHPIQAQKFIGYLPEHNPLYVEMYVREYLNFCASIHKVTKDSVESCIDKVGLSPEAHKKINQLSKGYRQRVGLAAALLHDPEVLILDEPTTGLDPNQLAEIRALIKEVGKDKTVLFSTHVLQEVEAICDRVIVINKGVIVEDMQLSDLKGKNLETHFRELTLA
jgi:ABC-2 type transport system ATP-binding protein